MNRVKELTESLRTSKGVISVFFSVVLLILILGFFSLGSPIPTLILLLCVVPAMRFLQQEEPPLKISTIRNNGKSIAFSDEGRKRFAALSAVEMRISGLAEPENNESQRNKTAFLKASKILAEYTGSFSIEVSNKQSAIRYFTTAEAKNASDACQKSEAGAERILRTIQELYGNGFRPGILEREKLQSTFLSIVGGEFNVLKGVDHAVVRDEEGSDEVHGLAVLTVNHPSFAKIDLRKLVSLIRNTSESVTYVINIQAHRTYNENVLIDGAECGRTWIVSPYFVVRGSHIRALQEASIKLRNDIEDITRSGVIRIEGGSSITRKLGMILFRWRFGNKLFLLNDQLIDHVFNLSTG